MSIRLTQGGHFFSRSLTTPPTEVKHIEVVVDGCDCITYPTQAPGHIDLQEMMEAAGVRMEGKVVVKATTDGAVGYAMAIEQTSAEAIEQWATEQRTVEYRSPLQKAVERALRGSRRREVTLALHLNEKVVYASLTEKSRLLWAEALPAETPEGLLYIVAAIDKDFPLAKAEIVISATEGAEVKTKEYKKVLKRYFGRVKTE